MESADVSEREDTEVAPRLGPGPWKLGDASTGTRKAVRAVRRTGAQFCTSLEKKEIMGTLTNPAIQKNHREAYFRVSQSCQHNQTECTLIRTRSPGTSHSPPPNPIPASPPTAPSVPISHFPSHATEHCDTGCW